MPPRLVRKVALNVLGNTPIAVSVAATRPSPRPHHNPIQLAADDCASASSIGLPSAPTPAVSVSPRVLMRLLGRGRLLSRISPTLVVCCLAQPLLSNGVVPVKSSKQPPRVEYTCAARVHSCRRAQFPPCSGLLSSASDSWRHSVNSVIPRSALADGSWDAEIDDYLGTVLPSSRTSPERYSVSDRGD